MLRSDITKAIDELLPNIRKEVTTQGGECLGLLNTYLAAHEEVWALSSASAKKDSVYNCLFALTSRRLIFVAPAPQAVAWRLSTITRAQSFTGYFFVEGDAGKYSPGLDSAWGSTFETQVKRAIAISVLAGE